VIGGAPSFAESAGASAVLPNRHFHGEAEMVLRAPNVSVCHDPVHKEHLLARHHVRRLLRADCGERIGAAAVAMLCAGPLCLLLTKRRSEYGSPVLATVAVVIVATSAMAALLGVVRAVLASSAALATLSALAASRGPMRLGEAGMVIANFLIGWLLLLGLSHA
jgi:hypothetical protein